MATLQPAGICLLLVLARVEARDIQRCEGIGSRLPSPTPRLAA